MVEPEGRPRALVLDTSYRPYGVIGWRRAMILYLSARAEALAFYDLSIRSPRAEYALPAVLRIDGYVHRRLTRVRFGKAQIWRRDGNACAYCGRGLAGLRGEVTVDHVVPVSRGGRTSWQNCVAACRACNNRKGDRTPEEAHMSLRVRPHVPRYDLAGEAHPMPAQWSAWLE